MTERTRPTSGARSATRETVSSPSMRRGDGVSRANMRKVKLFAVPLIDAVFSGLLVAAVAITTTLVLRNEAIDAYKLRVTESMHDIARVAAGAVDPAAFTLKMPEREERAGEGITRPLRQVQMSLPSVKHLYAIAPSGKDLVFLADTSPASNDKTQSRRTDLYVDAPPEVYRAVNEGVTTFSKEPYRDRWGDFMSIWKPVHNAEGACVGVIGMDINADQYQQAMAQIKDAVDRGFAIACVAGFGALAGVYFMRRKAMLADAVIRDSEVRFRELADAAPVMLWTADSDGKRLFFSSPWTDFTGLENEQLIDAGWLDAVHESDRDGVSREYHIGCSERRVFEIEYRIRRRDGEYRWVSDRVVPRLGERGELLGYVGGSMDVTERKGAEQALEHAALVDRLTGMPNRVLLLDRLQQAVLRYRRRPDRMFAVIFMDFDRFKFVNDTLGHESGDELLRQIGRRLRAVLRVSDSIARDAGGHMAARFGGDEFVVLLEDLASPQDATAIADRLLLALAEPFELAGRKIASTASMGVVISTDVYATPHDLLRDADTAMYEAKSAGKGRYVVFDSTMRLRVERRVRLEQDLASAVKNDELVLHYQPVVDLETGEMLSVEALVRWHHPVLGIVSPTEFIGIAEEAGQIDALGEWVFNESCAQFRTWADSGLADRIGTVAVNLSRKQLSKPDLTDRLVAAAKKHGVSPSAICLEITETAIMEDVSASLLQLSSLKAAGFKLALDDFGAGHSSLSNVHEFPIDSIKIDRAFIANMMLGRAHTALIQAVTTLAHNLNMRVIAEGVERAEQVPMLQSLDCDAAQGRYFCGPVQAEEITARCFRRSRAA